MAKTFYVEIGTHPSGDELFYDDGEQPEADGLYWGRRGGLTDSFPEAEARGIMLSKTYKHVRLASQETEVISHIEE